MTNPSYVVRKASSCSSRSTNPRDSGHVRLAVRRGTGDNWKNHLDSAARVHFPKCSGGPSSAHRLVHVSRFRGRRRSSIAGKHRRDAFLQRGPDVRDECRDDARLPTGMSPLMEPDMSGDRDGKVPADRRTTLLPAIWHRGLEDTISLHRFTEGFRQQRHRSRVAPRPPRGFDLPSRKMYDYLVSSDFGAETGCPAKNTGHNLKSYTEIHLLRKNEFGKLKVTRFLQDFCARECFFPHRQPAIAELRLRPHCGTLSARAAAGWTSTTTRA